MLLDLLSLLVVLTLGLLTPGPDFLLVLKNSMGGSRLRGFATAAGVTSGLALQMTAIALGFSALTPSVLRGVQWGGAAFLAWIGVRTLATLRSGGRTNAGAARTGGAVRMAYWEGVGCNLTNPKAFLFYVSMFAQVLKPGVAAAWHVILPVFFVVHGAVAWTLIVLALQAPLVARRLTLAQRWLEPLFATALLAFAAWTFAQAW